MNDLKISEKLEQQFDLLQEISNDIKKYFVAGTIEPEQYNFLIQASLAMIEIAKAI